VPVATVRAARARPTTGVRDTAPTPARPGQLTIGHLAREGTLLARRDRESPAATHRFARLPGTSSKPAPLCRGVGDAYHMTPNAATSTVTVPTPSARVSRSRARRRRHIRHRHSRRGRCGTRSAPHPRRPAGASAESTSRDLELDHPRLEQDGSRRDRVRARHHGTRWFHDHVPERIQACRARSVSRASQRNPRHRATGTGAADRREQRFIVWNVRAEGRIDHRRTNDVSDLPPARGNDDGDEAPRHHGSDPTEVRRARAGPAVAANGESGAARGEPAPDHASVACERRHSLTDEHAMH